MRHTRCSCWWVNIKLTYSATMYSSIFAIMNLVFHRSSGLNPCLFSYFRVSSDSSDMSAALVGPPWLPPCWWSWCLRRLGSRSTSVFMFWSCLCLSWGWNLGPCHWPLGYSCCGWQAPWRAVYVLIFCSRASSPFEPSGWLWGFA